MRFLSLKEYMYSTCEECCDTLPKITDFRDKEANIHFYQRKHVDKMVQKIEVSLLPKEVIKLLNDEWKVLKQQVFIKRHHVDTINGIQSTEGELESW